jgi:uncharacterized phage-like protein YoqJ
MAATGHRPERLGGYTPRILDTLDAVAFRMLVRLRPSHVISGMALGWDLAVAQAAFDLKIPYTAAIPFDGQTARWKDKRMRERWEELCWASKVAIIVTPGSVLDEWGGINAAYHRRDRWMVDHASSMLTLWDGREEGGTAATIAYALSKGKKLHHSWSLWKEMIG